MSRTFTLITAAAFVIIAVALIVGVWASLAVIINGRDPLLDRIADIGLSVAGGGGLIFYVYVLFNHSKIG